MQAPNKFFSVLARQAGRRYASHGYESGVKSTYNDLPSPSGSWKTGNDALQRRYNMQLALGVGVLLATIIGGKSAGLLNFYNDYPARPATIDNYKE